MKNDKEKSESYFKYFLIIFGLPVLVFLFSLGLFFLDKFNAVENTTCGFTDDGRYYVHYEKDSFFPLWEEDYTKIYEVFYIDGEAFYFENNKLVKIEQ